MAEFIFELLTGTPSSIASTDAFVMGHTIIKGEGFFIDSTSNIVVFADPAVWNDLSVEDRITALLQNAEFGVSRNLDAEELSPLSYAIFAAEGHPEALRQGWIDTVRLWPWTAI